MIAPIPFLVGAGSLPESLMRQGCLRLASAWGGGLIHYCCSESPRQHLAALPKQKGLVQLSGDAAMLHPEGMSWLEALGAWRQPTVLIVAPLLSGDIPGVAPAYVSLCKNLAVPLVGILQLGGAWDISNRKADGLPWCGLLPDDSGELMSAPTGDCLEQELSLQNVAALLRRRMLLCQ